MQGKTKSQKEINSCGTIYNRGLHGNEIFAALNKNNIIYKDLKVSTSRYSQFLREKIIPAILNGNPVLIGVKIYPDKHPAWSADHFILLVGYDPRSDELVFNSGERRRRIPVNKLLNEKEGYSLVNKYMRIYAIQFAGNTGNTIYGEK